MKITKNKKGCTKNSKKDLDSSQENLSSLKTDSLIPASFLIPLISILLILKKYGNPSLDTTEKILLTQLFVLLFQTAVFTYTLFILFRQNKNLKISLDFAAYQDVINRIQRVDEIIIENPRFGRFLPEDYSDSKSENEKISLVYLVLDFFEMIFILKEKEMISEEMWEPWKRSMIRCFDQSQDFKSVWDLKVVPNEMYYKPFRDFIIRDVRFVRKRV